ncbi:hypothetical protein EYF80_003356 [Liparis tanakae]|uniref:Uncharacterized protein n=1 Tax=Liparis tanakae TaxID=230148 RepID=A0A4Z2J8N4_9TELE|nr:hypothetical protein EYF80_003356 [Liparis tanakae]
MDRSSTAEPESKAAQPQHNPHLKAPPEWGCRAETARRTLRLRSLDRFLFFIFSSSFSLCSWAAASARSLVFRSCLAACAMVPLLLLLLLLL